MIHVKSIMAPVDFSEPSNKAANYGLSLALEFEARLSWRTSRRMMRSRMRPRKCFCSG